MPRDGRHGLVVVIIAETKALVSREVAVKWLAHGTTPFSHVFHHYTFPAAQHNKLLIFSESEGEGEESPRIFHGTDRAQRERSNIAVAFPFPLVDCKRSQPSSCDPPTSALGCPFVEFRFFQTQMIIPT